MTLRTLFRALVLAAGVAAVSASVGEARSAPNVVLPLGPTPAFREALRVSVYGNVLAARLAATVRDTSAASVYWRAALRQDPRNNEILERAFVTTLADGNVEEAMPLADRLIQVDRQHRLARLALAVRSIKTRQFQTARSHLSAAPRANADLTSALLTGWTFLGSGDAPAGVAAVDRLTGADWFQLFKQFHAGLIFDAAGRRADAGRRLEEAYKQDPTILRIVDAYGRWASRARNLDEARQVYSAFDKVVPNHPMIEDAQRRLREAHTLPPLVRNAQSGSAEVLYGLGSALSRQGGEDLALIYLQLARWLDPEHELAILSLADLYEFLKLPQRAIGVYDDMPQSSPLYRNAQIQRALNLDLLDKTDDARKVLQDLIAKKPNDLEALQALGNILRSRKIFAEAAEVYTKAIALIPNPDRQHWVYFYFRGISYERSQQWAKAEVDLKRAMELVPEGNARGRAQVLNYLGYSWVDQGINLDEGLRLVRRAVELTPEDGYIVDSLGWAYYRMGRFDDAVTELERAIELKPEDPVVNDHLGDAYWRVGRQVEAYFQWNHARDLKPEPDDLPRILNKIANGLRDDASPAGRTTGQAAQTQTAPN
ncbi:tetratricopeptide repeat protein [Phreatobacter stygius]|uniref:tetratricopeptide repeat protein n=1 Tax=Phreatobacter stygius TaxID=1940610 RepID=UPI001FEA14D4|nr:tetratricopeptide repeat protein [Phreatobacter stygius]